VKPRARIGARRTTFNSAFPRRILEKMSVFAICAEKATGVEFTNGDQSGVRLRKAVDHG
jgi:hypothetical protein